MKVTVTKPFSVEVNHPSDAMEGVLGKRPWHGPPQAADDRVDYLEASKRTVSADESPGAHVEVYDLEYRNQSAG